MDFSHAPPQRPGRAGLLAITPLAAALLSACASLSQPAPSDAALSQAVNVPAAWSAPASAPTANATSLAQWWQRFDDPLLGQLVAQALQANTSVRSAQAALQQARALRDASAAGLKPGASGSGSAQRGKSGGAPAGNSFSVDIDASWEPDIFGGNRSALNAAEADVRASAASLGDVQVSIAAEAAVAYIELRSAQARLAIARDNLASQLDTLQLTQWRVQAGLASSLDAEQARASTEQVRAQIPALETSVAQGRHALAVLTGQPPAALQDLLANAGPVPQAADDLALSFPADTLRQRPDVRAAEHQVSASLARVSQADAARYPSFRISGSLGLQALTLGGLTGGGALASALLGSVSVPIFDGGAAKAQVAAQQAGLEQARQGYRSAVLTALKDVEDALVALRGDRERLARLRHASEAASNAALLARQRYTSGLVDFQTVLDTQRTLLSAQESVAVASADLGSDHVRLYKALGGGWQPGGDAAAAEATPTRTPAAQAAPISSKTALAASSPTP
jgi:multidrug efflux system outer membrane protein